MQNIGGGEKNISYPEARKLVDNSVVTTTYANIAKPMNNSTQNQGITQHEMINVLKELKTHILRKNLTSLTTEPHTEADLKKNLQPKTNEDEDPPPQKNPNQTAKFKRSYYNYQTQQPSTKKTG